MGVMTMPLWRVLELTNDPYSPDADPKHLPLGSGFTIGLDQYPIYDETQRLDINKLIIDQFWNREIGQETISMFTFMMRRTMRQIMPTYNQLYKSTQLVFDPLSTYDLNTVRNADSTENSSNTTNANTKNDGSAQSRSVYFDTPQTALARNKDYAANATDVESSNENTGTTDSATSSDSTAHTDDTSATTGRQGSANRLLAEFRANIINTDLILLGDPELTTMFLLVWESGDEIAPPNRFRPRALGASWS
jgi:hypothetical protein